MARKQVVGSMIDYEDFSATAQGNGTTYHYVDMGNYDFLTLQILNTAGTAGTNTFTVEASAEDGTDRTALDYSDVTNDWFGSASYTSDQMLERDTQTVQSFVRVKVVRSADGGSEDGAWEIHSITKSL